MRNRPIRCSVVLMLALLLGLAPAAGGATFPDLVAATAQAAAGDAGDFDGCDAPSATAARCGVSGCLAQAVVPAASGSLGLVAADPPSCPTGRLPAGLDVPPEPAPPRSALHAFRTRAAAA